MKKMKHVFPAFSFYDRTGIQNYLEKKAQEGWMLEKMGGFSWKFRAIEPKKIHFAVTYFPKASAFDPGPSEQQKMFQEFCAHSGWQLAAASAQLQIFYNESEHPVPIETDPQIELENIHKSAKKTYLPTYLLLLPLGVVQWMNIGMAWKMSPLNVLSNHIYYFNALCSIILLLMCSTELVSYFSWYRRAKKAAFEDGAFVATRGTRTFQIILVTILIVALVFLLFSYADARMSVMLSACLIMIVVICAISIGATKLMKRMKISAKINGLVTMVLTVVLTFAGAGFGIVGIIIGVDEWWPEDVQTYEYKGHTINVYHDDLPLTIEDLMDTHYDDYSYRWTGKQETLLVRMYDAYQRPRIDALGEPELSYTIVEVKAHFLYDLCLKSLTDGTNSSFAMDVEGNIINDEYKPVNALPWDAKEAYQRYTGDHPYSTWILCYDECILVLDPDWDLTAEQMETVGKTFG